MPKMSICNLRSLGIIRYICECYLHRLVLKSNFKSSSWSKGKLVQSKNYFFRKSKKGPIELFWNI